MTSRLEGTLRNMALAFAQRFVTIAVGHTIDALRALDLNERAPTPARPWPPLPVPAPRQRGRSKRRGYLTRDAKRRAAHELADHVATLPWPARARELRSLLKLSKTPFLRVALLAVELGLVVRRGERAGATYFLGPAHPQGRKGAARAPTP